MKAHCLACGAEKDTSVKELYIGTLGLVADRPIDALFVMCCEGRAPHNEDDWRHVVVCHGCFDKLEPDMWISSDCWAKLMPVVPFERLPPHDDEPHDLSVERYAAWPLTGGKPPAQVLANIEDLQNFQVTDTVWGPKIRRYSFLIGMSWSSKSADEQREFLQLRDELESVGFKPGWEQA